MMCFNSKMSIHTPHAGGAEPPSGLFEPIHPPQLLRSCCSNTKYEQKSSSAARFARYFVFCAKKNKGGRGLRPLPTGPSIVLTSKCEAFAGQVSTIEHTLGPKGPGQRLRWGAGRARRARTSQPPIATPIKKKKSGPRRGPSPPKGARNPRIGGFEKPGNAKHFPDRGFAPLDLRSKSRTLGARRAPTPQNCLQFCTKIKK